MGTVRKSGPKRNWWLSRYQQSLVPWLICFVLGMALCAYQFVPGEPMPDWNHPWLFLSWVSVFFGVALLSSKRHIWVISVSLIAIVLGGGYYRWQHLTPGPQDVSRFAYGTTVKAIGEWYTQSETPKYALLRVQSVNAQPATGQLQVRLSGWKTKYPLPGALIAIEGRLSRPDVTTIPGAFQEWRYLASQRVTAILHHPTRLQVMRNIPVSSEGKLYQVLSEVRHRIAQTFMKALPSPLAEIQGGIVLGDQAIPVQYETRQAFVKTGLVHLLAASGMNVGIVAGLLFVLARLCQLPPRLQLAFGMLGGIVYAFLSGLSPSVLRATAMLEIALALKFLDKTLSHLLVLLLAVVGLLLWNAELVTNVGFQLSVVTTFGIITLLPPLQKKLGYYIGEGIAATILLPLVAQAWVTPLLMTYFNELPIFSLVLNLIAVPIVFLLTGLGFFAGLFGLLYQPIGIWIATLSWPCLWILNQLVSVVSAWQWTQWHCPSLSAFGIIFIYALLMAIVYSLTFPSGKFSALIRKILSRPKIAVSFFLLSITAILYGMNMNRASFTVHVLPLNHSLTAFILQDKNESHLLIPASVTPWYTQKIADYARHEGIPKFSTLIWLPSKGRQQNSSVRQAVIERLESRVSILDVPEREFYQAKSKQWQLVTYPGYTNLGFESVIQPLWQFSANRFCLSAFYSDMQSFTNTRLPGASCPIQMIEERNSSTRRLMLSWNPATIPDNRYFKFIYRANHWKIVD